MFISREQWFISILVLIFNSIFDILHVPIILQYDFQYLFEILVK